MLVVICQFGKVGSRSVLQALVDAGFTQTTTADVLANGVSENSVIHTHVPEDVEALSGHGSVKVITAVRRSIARNVSAFFFNATNMEHLHFGFAGNGRFLLDTPTTALIEVFRPRNLVETRFVLHRYFSPLIAMTGANLFAEPFDPVRGFQVSRGSWCDVFSFPSEDLDRLWGELSEFVGCELVSPPRMNDSAAEWYTGKYIEFKALYEPREDERYVCSAPPWMQHFYGPDYYNRTDGGS